MRWYRSYGMDYGMVWQLAVRNMKGQSETMNERVNDLEFLYSTNQFRLPIVSVCIAGNNPTCFTSHQALHTEFLTCWKITFEDIFKIKKLDIEQIVLGVYSAQGMATLRQNRAGCGFVVLFSV